MGTVTSYFYGSPGEVYKAEIQGKHQQHGEKYEELRRLLAVIRQHLSAEAKTDSIEDVKLKLSQCEKYHNEFQRHQQVTMAEIQEIGREVATARFDPEDGSDVWTFEESHVIGQREATLLAELADLEARFSTKFQVLNWQLERAEQNAEFREHEQQFLSINEDLGALKRRMMMPEDIQSFEERDEELKVVDELDKELKAQEERFQKWASIGRLSQNKPGWSQLTAEVWEATTIRALGICSTVLHQKRQRLIKWEEPPVRIVNLSHRVRLGSSQSVAQNDNDGDINPRFQRKNPMPRPVRDEFSVLKPLPKLPKKMKKKYHKLIASYPVTKESEIQNQALKEFIAATQAAAPTPSDREYTEQEVKRAETSDEPCDIVIAGLAKLFAAEGVDFMLTEDPQQSTLKNLMMIGNAQAAATKVVSVFTPEGLFKMSFDEFQNDILAQKRVELEVRTLAAQVFEVPIAEIAVLSFARGSEVVRFGCAEAALTLANMEKFTREFIKKFPTPSLHIETSSIQETLALSKGDFDDRGDFTFPEGGDTQQRGGCDYFQPGAPWKRAGLRVLDCYEDDDWLGMDGGSGEWAVGFHGSDKNGVRGIARSRTFKLDGDGQVHEESEDINPQSDNKNQLCGIGAYFGRDIATSEGYTRPVTLKNGRKYHLVFQCRLHPQKIRQSASVPDYLIINEAQYARPYGICYKECP